MQPIAPELAETLAAVIDTGTMDAAARRLHITPSAVSQRIKALEDRIGAVLLVRTKPARATAAGERIVRLARQYALLAHDTLALLGATADARGGRAATLPIAVNADSMASWFIPPLVAVGRAHDVVFDLHRDDQDFTAGLLESGEVMAAVTSQAVPVAGCRVRAIGSMRYVAVAVAELAVTAAERGIGSIPVVDFDQRDDLQSRWLRSMGVDPVEPVRHHVPGSHDFAIAVDAGLGWGMLPEHQLTGRVVPLGGDPIDVPLYWQQWNIESAALGALADAVAEAARAALRAPG